MIGNNELRLSQLAMNAALDHYLNSKVVKDSVTVTDVSFLASNGQSGPCFIVKFKPTDGDGEA